jgi:sugar lactone lactonase YvrE
MSIDVTIACTLSTTLGEGPVWDHRINRLHYVDIRGRAVLTFDPATKHVSRWPLAEMVGFVVLTPDPKVLVAGIESGLATLRLDSGTVTFFQAVEQDLADNRINDGTVAPDGAILFGTTDIPHAHTRGRFYRYASGALAPFGDPVVVTNGPAVTPNGREVLTVDSVGRTILSRPYNSGVFGPAALFARIPDDQGVPDGIAFDVEGCAWVCHYGGARITRFRPDGSIDFVMPVPTHQPTKCAFGGPDLRTVYVTTSAYRRSLADDPHAGALLAFQSSVPGVRAEIAKL